MPSRRHDCRPYHGSNHPQHNSQSAVKHHSDITWPTVTWLSQCLHRLGPTQNIAWVYLIHDLGSASSPANRTNEKGRLNLQFWVPYRDTQVKSCAKTMKHHHCSKRKRSLLAAHSLINFIYLKFLEICNTSRSSTVLVNTDFCVCVI